MYTSLHEFRSAKERARMDLDRVKDDLSGRWQLLQTPATRGILLRDAFGDVLRSWKPYKHMQNLVHGRVNGDTLMALGSLYASTRPTWGKRALYGGISVLLGKLLGGETSSPTNVLSTVVGSIGKVVAHFRERKAAKANEAELEQEMNMR